jgi:hypothetical protein
MSNPHEKMLQDMQLRGFSPNTQSEHTSIMLMSVILAVMSIFPTIRAAIGIVPNVKDSQGKVASGAGTGIISVLHTWGQNLMDHPHVHCIVPGGGLSFDGIRFVPSPNLNDFYFKLFTFNFTLFIAPAKRAIYSDLCTLSTVFDFPWLNPWVKTTRLVYTLSVETDIKF